MPVRSYVEGNFQLVLDGVKCGFLKSVDGGAAVAEVVAESGGQTYFAKKRLGAIRYSPLAMQFDLSMSRDVYDWINASWSGKYNRKNGAVVASNQRFVAVSQREFFNALLTEVTIPALDGSSKDPAYLTLKCAPEYTQTGKASGAVSPVAMADQKLWLPSNFRVTIDGLDCTRVVGVDAFTVKQSVATDDIGDARIDLFNLGIFKLAADKREANSEAIATATAKLYCERMALHVGEAPKPVAAPRTAGGLQAKARRRGRR